MKNLNSHIWGTLNFLSANFYAPASLYQAQIVFALSVSLSDCLFVSKNFHIGHKFWMVCDGTFIFYMCIPCGKTFSLLQRSRSSVRVKYQGCIFQKKGCWEGISNSKASLFHFGLIWHFAQAEVGQNLSQLHLAPFSQSMTHICSQFRVNGTVSLGGIRQKNNFSKEKDQKDTEGILQRCYDLWPCLKVQY